MNPFTAIQSRFTVRPFRYAIQCVIWTFLISPILLGKFASAQTDAAGSIAQLAPWQLGMPQFNGLPSVADASLPQLPAPTNPVSSVPADQAAHVPVVQTPSYQVPVGNSESGLVSNAAATSDVFQLPNYRYGDSSAAPTGGEVVQVAAHTQAPATGPPSYELPSLPNSGGGAVGSSVPPAIPGAITDAINGVPMPQPPPLQQEVEHWYSYPWRWLTNGWKNHAELGIDGSNGNAETLAIQSGLEMKRKTDDYTLAIDIDYRFANTRDQVTNTRQATEDNGRFNLDYDRILNDSPWSAFGKFGLEFDEFKVFDLRVNINGGVGYHWIRNDRTTVVTRFGAGASQEIGSPDDAWKPEAVFGFEGEHQVNDSNKLKAKIDYFPAWEDFSDFRFVTDLAWEILLDDSENLSLKLALTDRYDSTPQGAKPNDVYYSLLLLVKF